MVNDLINYGYVMNPLWKSQWRGSESFQVGEHMGVLGGGMLKGHGRFLSLPTYLALCIYFI